MKFLYLLILIPFTIFSAQTYKYKNYKTIYLPSIIPQNMSSKVKKDRFFYLIVKPVQKVHSELLEQYYKIDRDIQQFRNHKEIKRLKKEYRASTDLELLQALKPHPKSIVIAQAAMESAWATSRFFIEANNVFGMWSADSDEPRVAASQKRNGTKTIWLRKFFSIEESIREYYKLIGRGKSFKEFRELRYKTDNPFEIVTKLDKYSEIGDRYAFELMNIIEYNNLTKYD